MKLNKFGIRTKRQKRKPSKGVTTKGNKVRQQKARELSEELPSTSRGAVSKQLRSREFNLLIRCANQQFKEIFKQYTNNKKHFEEEAAIIFNDEVSLNSMPLHLENNIEELNKIRAMSAFLYIV
ncbi:uncharacterized protein LOC119674703 [Teleopsis dalmanni]|uniref:uncharacterized protein LOC119674703 n=1 Tax=Teleopsis dalmanni TaxID=139649 RepID=UPI0018CD8BFF|nr:uncharacterized protein LOC119674703 [Teleopsis dalmanni]